MPMLDLEKCSVPNCMKEVSAVPDESLEFGSAHPITRDVGNASASIPSPKTLSVLVCEAIDEKLVSSVRA